MAILLILLLGAPSVAIVASLALPGPTRAECANLAASGVSFAAAIGLVVAAPADGAIFGGGYLLVDPLGAWVVLCAAAVYLLASIHARGYMRLLDEDARLGRFYALFAGFALSN
jgi:hydrogenase-4 component F